MDDVELNQKVRVIYEFGIVYGFFVSVFDKVKAKVFVVFETEHLIDASPHEHLLVVKVALVEEFTTTLIINFSFSFGEPVAFNNAIEFNGVIAN